MPPVEGSPIQVADQVVAIARSAARLDADAAADWLLVRDYEAGGRSRTIVFFLNTAAEPIAVVKVRPLSGTGRSLQKEAEVLRKLRDVVCREVRETLPRNCVFTCDEAHEVLVLSALPGRALAILMQRSLRPIRSHLKHLANAGRWVGHLHASTRNGSCVAVHGDLWPRNVLFHEDGQLSGVVDWEDGSLTGSPWQDLFTLPLLFATDPPSWSRVDPLAAFDEAFTRPSSISDGVAEYFRAYRAVAGSSSATICDGFEEFLESSGEAGPGKKWQRRFDWPALAMAFRRRIFTVF